MKSVINEGYGEIGSDRAIAILIELLEPYNFPCQYFFGTERTAKALKITERRVVCWGAGTVLFRPALLAARRELDRAVMKLYGFPVKDFSESDCVAALMERYQVCIRKGVIQ